MQQVHCTLLSSAIRGPWSDVEMKPKGPGICHIASHVEMKKMSGLLCKMLTAYFITVNSGAKALTTNDFFSYGTAAGDTLFLTSNDYFTRASDDLLSNVAYSIYKRPHRNIIVSVRQGRIN